MSLPLLWFQFATEVSTDVAANDLSGVPSILAPTAGEAYMDSRMSPSLKVSGRS